MSGNSVIEHISPHTIKKFELIEEYVKAWAHKLLQNQWCRGIVFIDCMCNSGEYIDTDKNKVFGTPVRVAKILRDAAGQYPHKQINIYFNDKDEEKIAHLQSLLGKDKDNFHIHLSVGDGNLLLGHLYQILQKDSHTHSLLVYDPYDAQIDWNAIMPFLNNWGEVIINHMVSDSARAVGVVKSPEAVAKYEQTYLADIQHLIPYASDKQAYEKRVEDIIKTLRINTKRKYYIAAFPFFNKRNALLYNLIHCTSNPAGFKLYKSSAWKIFGGKSSTKDTHGKEKQMCLDFEGIGGPHNITDSSCYYIQDIAEFIQRHFAGQQNVDVKKVWDLLDEHPIFPSDGFKKEIKQALKNLYRAQVHGQRSISFANGGNQCPK